MDISEAFDTIQSVADDVYSEVSGDLFLYFQAAHFLLVINGVKSSWSGKASREQPFLTWCLSMTCCFGGGVLVKLLSGGKALAGLNDNTSVLLATFIWWAVFYFPMNVVGNLMKYKSVGCVLYLFKELLRSKKVVKGVTIGLEAYPESVLSPIILGVVASCGGSFIKSSSTLINSQWNSSSIAYYRASFVTKFCLLFSFFHVLFAYEVLPESYFSHEVIALCQAVVLYFITVFKKFDINFDISESIEPIFSFFFMTMPENLALLLTGIFADSKVETTKAKNKTKSESKKKR